MKKVSPDPPPVEKILNFFGSNEPFPYLFILLPICLFSGKSTLTDRDVKVRVCSL